MSLASLPHPNAIQHANVHLPRGTLTLTYATTSDYQLADLLGFAERINPKRAFLFVSKVLGRHIPVAPAKMRRAFVALAAQIPDDLPTPIVVFGMAETAVGLAAGVHSALQARYPDAILLNSTRHAQDAPLFATFSEDHSHASRHLVYQSRDPDRQAEVLAAKTLIVVDDEASTGQTCQNVVHALRQAGMHDLSAVHLATLVDWSLAQPTTTPNDSLDGLPLIRHHLLAGSWRWNAAPNPPPLAMPRVDSTAAGSQPILPTGQWGRTPTRDSQTGLATLWANLSQQVNLANWQGKNVLVLGSNEFVWLPFLLAERLAHQLADTTVKFGALTRSPIAVSTPTQPTDIHHVLSFADNYGLGMTNFVYNVTPSDWHVIVLCLETPPDSVDTLWRSLDNVVIVSPAQP